MQLEVFLDFPFGVEFCEDKVQLQLVFFVYNLALTRAMSVSSVFGGGLISTSSRL